MGVYNATVITTAGQNLIASAIAGGDSISFSSVKTSTHVYPAGTALQNLTSLSDVKQTVAPTSVDVYNNNVVQISARVPNTGIATAYLINTIGLFGSAGGAETLIAVLTAQTPDEVPVFDAEAPAAFIFNIQMTIQNADEVVFEVNDTGTATVADLNRVAQPFSGATASAAGSGGRVPAPAAGDDGKFLRGDATWTAPADMVEAFTSSDVADGGATAWTGVNPLTSGETNKSIFAKLSQMFKNIRYLYKMLGTTDISSIGNGTVTGGLSSLNDSLSQIETFQPGVDPAEWTGNYTNTFSNPITAYKAIMIWAEYNGQVMDSITAPLTFFAGKPVYLGWNDGSLKASAKIQVSSNYGSATVSGFTGFTKVALRGIR